MATTDLTEAETPRPVAEAIQKPRRRFGRVMTGSVLPRIVLIGAALLFITPFYWMIVSALKSNAELTIFPPTLIPGAWVWQNFIDAVNYIPFGLYAINSLIITIGITIGSVLSNTVVAYGFSRIQWPGRNMMFYVCIATLFLPYPVILVALFDIFGKLPSFGLQGARSWVDTFLPLIVPAFFGNPFYIFLMRQFMLGIPRELSDAARVDGASEIQTFWRGHPAADQAGHRRRRDLRRGRRLERVPPAAALPAGRLEVPARGRPGVLHQPTRRRLQPAHGAPRPWSCSRSCSSSCFAQRFFVEGITVGGVKG